MSTLELRKRLIEQISITKDEKLLEEAFRLLEIGNNFETYTLNENQKNIVNEARTQIKRGEHLSDEQVNREIENGSKGNPVLQSSKRTQRYTQILENPKQVK